MRYRKAAIFMGISVVAGLLTKVIDFGIVALLLTAIVLILVTCFDTVIRIFYLIYLKRTREEYKAFPTNMENGQSGDYI